MENDPAKKANKAKYPLDAIYPLEWEAQALREVSRGFQTAWRANPKRFEKLTEENKSINAPIRRLESENKELIALYEKTFRLLILREPFLYRILTYISFAPKEKEARKTFFKKYLQNVRIETYHDCLDQDVLVSSELAKSRKLSGIPLHSCFVGKVLQWMLNRFDSQRLTDEGNPGLVRFERIPKGLLIEYMNEADFNSPDADSIADDILYKAINSVQRDQRQHLFFGKGVDDSEWRIIKRFGKEEKEIPFQILPKYAGLVKKWAKSLPKIETTVRGNNGKIKTKLIYDFTSVEMSFLEAVLDKTPEKTKSVKLPFAALIKKQLTWRIGKKWDEESTEALAEERLYRLRKQYAQSDEKDVQAWFEKEKRISKSAMEKSGGSLDDFIDRDEKADRRIDLHEDEDGISPEDEMLERDNSDLKDAILVEMQKDLRLMQILRIQESGERMSPEDQKYRWRKIKEIKNKFDLP